MKIHSICNVPKLYSNSSWSHHKINHMSNNIINTILCYINHISYRVINLTMRPTPTGVKCGNISYTVRAFILNGLDFQ